MLSLLGVTQAEFARDESLCARRVLCGVYEIQLGAAGGVVDCTYDGVDQIAF